MKRLRRKPPEAEIPTSSTGDIAFLLIVFFMVTASFVVTKGLAFRLPEQGPAPENSEAQDAITIEIGPSDPWLVDCQPLAADALLDYVEAKLARNPSMPVVLYAHEGVSYQRFVTAYELMRQLAASGRVQPDVRIPTPEDIAEYVAHFGHDPFASYCAP